MDPNNAALLQEALSAGIGVTVELRPRSNSEDLFLDNFNFYAALCPEITLSGSSNRREEVKISHASVSVPSVSTESSASGIILFVRTITGITSQIEVDANALVSSLKQRIFQTNQIPPNQQNLVFAGRPLEDGRTIASYNIQDSSTVHLIIKLLARSTLIDPALLDPSFDYDFTNINDTGKSFSRGRLPYYRPCGWRRFALKVAGKYDGGNDTWLGSNNANGEWAVSYHGTDKEALEKILANRCMQNSSLQNVFTRGFYSSPTIDYALESAKSFNFRGVNYLVVFQNRINVAAVKIVDNGRYYISNSFDHIRPYSICIKRA